MFAFSDPKITSIVLLILFLVVVYELKPSIFFTKKGKLKSFGTGKNKTICPLIMCMIWVAMISYIVCKLSSCLF